MADLNVLPEGLPVPVDDGACIHLAGNRRPPIDLPATSGLRVELFSLPRTTVIYCYPMTGRPDRSLPDGWNEIPGARGCTPQSCAFRDHYRELRNLGVDVYGLSTQTTEYQREAVDRLHLPYELLSDADLKLVRTLELPTFKADSMTLIKRLTMIVADGVIEKVFYPVFPPDKNAEEVIKWLTHQ
jgi:peroxiredoxin